MEHSGVKYILNILGIAGLILFIVPFFYGYRNIGGVTGILLCLFYLLYINRIKEINAFIRSGWSKNNRNYLSLLLQIIVLVSLVKGIYISSTILQFGIPDDRQDRTAIVLGCEVNNDGTPSALLQSRLDAGIEYLNNHKNSVIIVSGGMTSSGYSEGKVARNYLISREIPENRIFDDQSAASTYQNLLFAKNIIQNNHLNEKVIIITNPFHQRRAITLAKELDLDAVSLYAKTPWWLKPTYFLREIFGVAYMLITR